MLRAKAANFRSAETELAEDRLCVLAKSRWGTASTTTSARATMRCAISAPSSDFKLTVIDSRAGVAEELRAKRAGQDAGKIGDHDPVEQAEISCISHEGRIP